VRRDEVDVAVTEGPAGRGVPTDSNRSEALEVREHVEELTLGNVRVEIADVKRSRGGSDRRSIGH